MTSISKNVYIDKLNNIVNKYSNTYRTAIKLKPADIKSNAHVTSSKELNDKNPKFKIGDIVRISKYQNIFAKSYVLWKYVISDLNSEEIVGEYYRNKIQKKKKKKKKNQKSLELNN